MTTQTAIAVPEEEAERTLKVFRARQLPVSSVSVGPWALLFIASGDWRAEFALDHGLVWTGAHVRKQTSATWGSTAGERSRLAFERDDIASAVSLAFEASRVWPKNYQLVRWQGWLMQATGEEQKAVQLFELANMLEQPAVAREVRFGRELTLLGVDVDHVAVDGNREKAVMRYYWLCPPGYQAEKLAVFVHVKNSANEIVAQDDHVLLEGVDPRAYSQKIPVVVERAMELPVQNDPLTCWIGVYQRDPPRKRIKLETKLTSHNHSFLAFDRP